MSFMWAETAEYCNGATVGTLPAFHLERECCIAQRARMAFSTASTDVGGHSPSGIRLSVVALLRFDQLARLPLRRELGTKLLALNIHPVSAPPSLSLFDGVIDALGPAWRPSIFGRQRDVSALGALDGVLRVEPAAIERGGTSPVSSPASLLRAPASAGRRSPSPPSRPMFSDSLS